MARRIIARSRSQVLLIGTWLLVALTLGAGAVLGARSAPGGELPPMQAWLLLMCVYWVGCWTIILRDAPLLARFQLLKSAAHWRIGQILTWLPAVAVGLIAFRPVLPFLLPTTLVIAVALAGVNAVTEETLWRGAFVMRFPDRPGLAVLYPLAPFTAWHVAIIFIPIDLGQAGAAALLGGAAFMGSVWGAVAWRTRSLRLVILAHAVTNVFAFSALLIWNRPLS